MIFRLIGSVVAGLVVGLAVTGFLQSTIYFSLFIGIPAGIMTAATVFAIATLKKAGPISKEPKGTSPF
jgi:hypothetical protein